MNPWEVTPDMVLAASGNASRTAEDIHSQLIALQNFVETLGASWLGYASDTWSAMMAEYTIEANKLHQALVEISETLQRNFQIYVGMEQDNTQGMLQLRSALAPVRL